MNKPAKKSLKERMIDAEVMGSRWLGNANEALDAGDKAKAEKCFEKAQFWLDRFNKLREQQWQQ